jgi:Putative abortive phage resistance protein AbiGi, antitoxin
MSKEWAKKRMINPITYSLPGTYTTQLIMETYKELLKYLSNDKDELRRNELIAALNTVGAKLHRLLNILKPYKGRLWRNGEFSNHIVRFYDEREWRYVPDIYKVQKDSLSMEEFSNSETRELENEKLSLINTLNFTPHDIKYIIVKDETEVLDFMRKVETIKSHFSKNDVKLLTSKIITMEQIKEDF